MNRVSFLVDGFNLYHSVKSASEDLGLKGKGTRWLNIQDFCSSYLSSISAGVKDRTELTSVFYFSALARHIIAKNPGVVARHETYIRCLENSGVTVELARFKKNTFPCNHCGARAKRYEEKETDVAIAAKLLEIFFLDLCDTAVIVSGDTDILPAVRTAQRLFPTKNVMFMLPYKRHNKEIADAVSMHFEVKKETYANHQFPDPFVTPKGKVITKPANW